MPSAGSRAGFVPFKFLDPRRFRLSHWRWVTTLEPCELSIFFVHRTQEEPARASAQAHRPRRGWRDRRVPHRQQQQEASDAPGSGADPQNEGESSRVAVMSPCRRVAVSLCRRVVVSSCRCDVVSLCRRVVVSSCRRVVVSPCRRVVVSSCRRVVVSSCRRVVVSSCRRVVVSGAGVVCIFLAALLCFP